MYRRFGKRLLDLALAVPGLVVLAPVMMAVALVIRVTCGTSVIFRQRRPGRYGRIFELLKFRSMTDRRDERGVFFPDEERLTAFGRFLRRTSLDELPSLLNVLKGEMSLVGPRPLLIRYLPHYTETEQSRMDVLPGITGWAQIHGRNELPWDERLACDVWYVRNLSFMLDMRILFFTVMKVLRREGVHLAPSTMMRPLDVERTEGRQ